jgi:hypothetical protein
MWRIGMSLDVAVVYAPQYRPGMRVELLLEEKLVLVTIDADTKAVEPDSYVYVDWGPDFAHHHELSFPEETNPSLFVGLGPLALTYIMEAGGSGYFRQRVTEICLTQPLAAATSIYAPSANAALRALRMAGAAMMTRRSAAIRSMPRDAGLVTKTVKSPRERIRARRRFSSSIGPRI